MVGIRVFQNIAIREYMTRETKTCQCALSIAILSLVDNLIVNALYRFVCFQSGSAKPPVAVRECLYPVSRVADSSRLDSRQECLPVPMIVVTFAVDLEFVAIDLQ